MNPREFERLDFLSHADLEAVNYGEKQLFVLTLGLTRAGQTQNVATEKRLRIVLDHHRADQLARGLLNGIQGVHTLH